MFDVIMNDYVLWYIAKDFLSLSADHPVQQSGHLWFTVYSCNLYAFQPVESNLNPQLKFS